MENEPKIGWLKNGGRAADPKLMAQSPRCGAKRRNGESCRAPAMWSKVSLRYTRCRIHGGKSTGPRTPEGLERSRTASLVHGRRSKAAAAVRAALTAQRKALLT